MNVQTVAVIGAGLMGSGIAQSLAMGGKSVMLYDISEEAHQKGMNGVQKSLARFVKAGQLQEADVENVLGRISVTLHLDEAVKDADIVIEAVSENLELKKKVFKQIDQLSKNDAILATNTSELSVTAIAAATERPERVLGMHWFNPAPVMKLIQIVKGIDTSEDTINVIQQLSEEIGKVTVVVKDVQGFVTTRALAAHMLECM
jgi:3-hydroxybutyryl-CoA dehydrogenase